MVQIVLDQIQAQLRVSKQLLSLVTDQQKLLVKEEFDRFMELGPKKKQILTQFEKLESSALLGQIVEDEYEDYSAKDQQQIEDLLLSLTETVGEVIQADLANQNFIKQQLNHPTLAQLVASAEDVQAAYESLGPPVLSRQHVDRKN
ncbi:hypothetical protein CMK12_14505 [Candidatus Poribacteria bacterium]|jgi:flagellar biosynthesis/type III secretory pathway chaperone|nr:hypothetical protein [Candidatus Poribacteria bacterium]MDP6597291.1 hypothetical protein [Candidatus Poribacteria bacterium]MDP6961169.1 hypothetical protein [Dehalococcoidia bacterium]